MSITAQHAGASAQPGDVAGHIEVGPALAAGLYALLWRTTRPYRDPAARPALEWERTGDTDAEQHRSNQDESIARTGDLVRSGR